MSYVNAIHLHLQQGFRQEYCLLYQPLTKWQDFSNSAIIEIRSVSGPDDINKDCSSDSHKQAIHILVTKKPNYQPQVIYSSLRALSPCSADLDYIIHQFHVFLDRSS